jgi:hypothetical protein
MFLREIIEGELKRKKQTPDYGKSVLIFFLHTIFYCLYISSALVNSLAPGGNALHRLGLYSISTEAPLKISFLLFALIDARDDHHP